MMVIPPSPETAAPMDHRLDRGWVIGWRRNAARSAGGQPAIRPTAMRRYAAGRRFGRAFTLIEIMIVVAIMGVVLTMSVPMIYKVVHKNALRKAGADVQELFSRARTMAIMQDTKVDVNIYPVEGRFTIGGAAPAAAAAGDPNSEPAPAPAPVSGAGLSAQLDTTCPGSRGNRRRGQRFPFTQTAPPTNCG
jgi:prepilin-type N-terminal cleavage/methylation domain-containing protein